jgi:hypothetical protein
VVDKIAKLVKMNNGYIYETAGVINAFFESPDEAYRCAEKISEVVGLGAVVYGDQIVIEMQR